MKFNKLSKAMFLAFAPVLVTVAYADNDDTALTLETVTVEGSLPTTLGTSTDKVTQGTSILRLFDNSPGVNFDTNGKGTIGGISIRGLGGRPDMFGNNTGQVKITLDGVTLPDSFTFGHGDTHSIGYFDPLTLSTVSVDRGPSFNADTSAVGGVIKLRTKDVQDVVKPGKTFGVLLQAGYNSANNSKYSSVAGGFQDSSVSGYVQTTQRTTHENKWSEHIRMKTMPGTWSEFLKD